MSLVDKIAEQVEDVATRVVEVIVTRQNTVTANQNGAGKVQSIFVDADGNRRAKVLNALGQIQEVGLLANRPLGRNDVVTIEGGFAR